MALSASDAARLALLQGAYDKLLTGQNRVRIEADGQSVTYGQGNMARLKAEIDALNALASTGGQGRTRGAVRFSV